MNIEMQISETYVDAVQVCILMLHSPQSFRAHNLEKKINIIFILLFVF